MLPLKCPMSTMAQTLSFLQISGKSRQECVVLWLGRKQADCIEITAVLRPMQHAKADMFHIPPASMREIMDYLKKNRLMIAAQVHSHPEQAFHSSADDTWAIIRHVGAVSIVLPYFASKTTPATFMRDAATFTLTAENRWVTAREKVVEMI